MFVVLPNGIKVTFVFTLYGKVVTINVHATNSQGVDAAALNAAVNSAKAWWTNHLKPIAAVHLAIVSISAVDVSREGGSKVNFDYAPPETGSANVESMSNNVALVMSLRTNRIGRSYRGRIYIPGIPENAVTGNLLTTQAASDYAAAAAGLITRFTTGTQQLVVASYRNQGVPRTVAVATPIQSTIVGTRVDTQRRRLPR